MQGPSIEGRRFAGAMAEKEAAARVLRAGGWLAHQPTDFQDALLANGRVERFARGEVIFRYGDPPGGLYGVVDGIVIYYRGERQDPDTVLHVSHAGAWFGEPSMMRRAPRMVTAAALETTRVVHLPLARFEALVKAHPEYWRFFALLAVEAVDVLVQLVDDMRAHEPRARLAARILSLLAADPPGRIVEGGTLAVTQTELAAIAGMSRNTVNRLLQDFAAHGALELGYGRIVVIDVAVLRAALTS